MVSLLAIQRSDRSHVSRNSVPFAWDAKTTTSRLSRYSKQKGCEIVRFSFSVIPYALLHSAYISLESVLSDDSKFEFMITRNFHKSLSILNDTSFFSTNKDNTICPPIHTYNIQRFTRTSIICMFKPLTSWLRGDWRDPVYSEQFPGVSIKPFRHKHETRYQRKRRSYTDETLFEKSKLMIWASPKRNERFSVRSQSTHAESLNSRWHGTHKGEGGFRNPRFRSWSSATTPSGSTSPG